MKRVRFGVLGVGRIGKLHLENLYSRIPMAEAVLVADTQEQLANDVASQFNGVKVAESPQALLDSTEIDAVAICSSTDTHAQFIVEAAKAKKHVFCEKPVDLSLEKIQQSINAVKENEIFFQVGFNRRFDSNFSEIAKRIQENGIGEVHSLRIVSRDPGPPPIEYIKSSGGLFLDMAIHDFDMARFLLKDEVKEVYAVGGNFIDPAIKEAGDIDSAVSILKFQNGAICTIDNSRKAVFGYDQRVEVFGAKGCLSCDNKASNSIHFWNESGAHEDPPFHFFLDRYVDSYLMEMSEFVQNLVENSQPTVGGLDGLEAVRIGIAAQKSLTERRPVRMEEI